MRKIILLLTMLCLIVSVHAQIAGRCTQKIDLYSSDANRSWVYNDLRFYKLLWEGMMKGELNVYSYDYDNVKPTTVADIYYQYVQARTLEFEYMGLYDEPIVMTNRYDSVQALRPVYIEILSSYEGSADTIRLNKEWFRISSMVEPEFGYTFSYPELVAFLDQKKSYWVNPFQAGDSVLFSKALQEERFVFEWRGETSDVKFYDGYNYAGRILTASGYSFDGVVIRYAELNAKPNMPYEIERPAGNLISVLMSAYFSNKIKGYEPYENSLYTADTYRTKVLSVAGDNIFYEGEEEAYEISYSSYADYLDMFSINYYTLPDTMKIPSLLIRDKPYRITLCISPEKSYREVTIPFISFDFSEAMEVLEQSGLMWYAADNHADSCSLASAIRSNKVYWRTTSICDKTMHNIYSCEYYPDSTLYKINTGGNTEPFIQNFIDLTIKNVKAKMNTQYAGKNISARTSLPVYLRYKGIRILDQLEDESLRFMPQLSEYIVNKALEGKITIYATDSLNSKMSKAEFSERMVVIYYSEDESANQIQERDSLRPDDFYVMNVSTDFSIDAKGKLTMKDRAIQLRIPGEFNLSGIEIPLACFSYQQLVLLMKKDKQGKELLKQFDATIKQRRYKRLYDPYGYAVYDLWRDEFPEEQIKRVPSAITPYIQN